MRRLTLLDKVTLRTYGILSGSSVLVMSQSTGINEKALQKIASSLLAEFTYNEDYPKARVIQDFISK